MIFSTKQPVRVALCCVILMVSLSKCEIDSSSSIIITTAAAAITTTTTAPEKVQLGKEGTTGRTTQSFSTSVNTAFSIPSSVETSSSYSSSSSSFKKDMAAAAAVTFNNANTHWRGQQQEERQQQQEASGPNNANIINGTITPSAVSPILTSPVLQEVVDSSDREQVAHEKQGQILEQRRNFVAAAHQNQDNIGINEGQTIGETTLSSSFGASQPFIYNNNNNINTTYYKTMSSRNEPHFPQKSSSSRTTGTGNRAEARPEATARQDSLGIELRLPFPSSSSSTSPSLRRQQAALLSRIGANGDKFISSSLAKENNEGGGPEDEEEKENGIPTHTWIPAGLTFSCRNRVPGYYSDASSISKCQVYHMCMTDGRKYTLLCGIGTVFNQLTFVCDHWYNYKCSEAESDYKINKQLWEEFVVGGGGGGRNDEEVDKDEEDELEDQNNSNENNPSDEAVIESDLVHQSMPLRSPFTTITTSSISKTRSA